jgi:hypothetical protein
MPDARLAECVANAAIPYWIQVLQALLTPAIAAIAVLIGIFQWRTAQQKVVLDLFDRRLAKYTALREVVARVMGSGAATNENSFQFLQALDGVEFLFGDDIVQPLQKISEAIGLLTVTGPERKDLPAGPELQALVKREREALKTVESFYSTFHEHLKPYLRMHQKSVWRPWS